MRNNGATVGVSAVGWFFFCSLRLLPVVGPVTYSVCICIYARVCSIERDREQQLERRREKKTGENASRLAATGEEPRRVGASSKST